MSHESSSLLIGDTVTLTPAGFQRWHDITQMPAPSKLRVVAIDHVNHLSPFWVYGGADNAWLRESDICRVTEPTTKRVHIDTGIGVRCYETVTVPMPASGREEAAAPKVSPENGRHDIPLGSHVFLNNAEGLIHWGRSFPNMQLPTGPLEVIGHLADPWLPYEVVWEGKHLRVSRRHLELTPPATPAPKFKVGVSPGDFTDFPIEPCAGEIWSCGAGSVFIQQVGVGEILSIEAGTIDDRPANTGVIRLTDGRYAPEVCLWSPDEKRIGRKATEVPPEPPMTIQEGQTYTTRNGRRVRCRIISEDTFKDPCLMVSKDELTPIRYWVSRAGLTGIPNGPLDIISQ